MEHEAPIIVLVTLQRLCARLIRSGADMALKQRCPLKVLHVAQVEAEAIKENGIKADVLNELYALANEAGAEMCVLTAKVPVNAMAQYAKDGQPGIFAGRPAGICGLFRRPPQLFRAPRPPRP